MGNSWENRIYEFEDFRLDAEHLLLYHKDEEVSLTPKAIETLLALLERRGEVVGKNDLMEMIWADTIVEESNLAQYLHQLRKTLGKQRDGKPFIETLKRRGYRFNGAVTVSESTHGFSEQESERARKSSNGISNRERQVKGQAGHLPRVERRGNVLALVDWQESRRDGVEESSAALRPSSERPSVARSNFVRLILIAACAALLLTGIWLIRLNSASDIRTAAVNGDLTFLNLTNGEPVDCATISPDGSYFVYASHDDERAHLWLHQTGQASRQEIIPPFEGGIYNTTFTPDSQFVYFVANENPGTPNTLYRIPALGGVRTKVLSNIDSPVSVSPDGRELVFSRWNHEASQSSLIVASSDGMRERVLLTRTGDEAIYGGAWSPNDNLIAFSSRKMNDNEGQCTIAGIDPQNGETKILSPEKWDTCYRMAWTRDGEGLVFVGTKFQESLSTRRDQIFYLSVADGESRRLTTDGNWHQYLSIGVTDRDEILVVPFSRASQIWSMDASGDSRTVVQITTGQADGRGGIEPLADGSISYLTRNGDGFSIWLMNADGTGRKQLTTDPSAIEELRAAPDGSFVVFAAKLDRLSHFYRIDADGTNLKQLTSGESNVVDSAVSPDGSWIVYNSTVFNGSYGKTALWKISSDGGEPVQLGDIDCVTPHFSPDGKFVSCVSQDWKEISIISAENGATIASFETVKNSILNVGARWTPDGEALAYIAIHKNVGNLWLQPTNGDAKYALTDFTSGDIYNFAFATIGQRLYLARGYPTRNAVLIRNFK